MADWGVVADLGTAGGTALLAVATFFSTRSANRAARSAERALLEGLRPLLVPSRWQDPVQKIRFIDEHWVAVQGGRGAVEVTATAVYLTMSLRNVGRGLAVLHGWDVPADNQAPPREPTGFRRLTRDVYVPAGDLGFWLGTVRDVDDPLLARLTADSNAGRQIIVDLLYGDTEGGQRVVTRMSMATAPGEDPAAAEHPEHRALAAARHWQLDRPGPR